MPTPLSPHAVRLEARAAADIEAAWRAAHEQEPCGYLLGTASDGSVAVTAAVVGRNVHPRPQGAFLLDPDEQLAVRRGARRAGRDVVGTWHGHLVGEPTPSRADEVGVDASGPRLMLIAGPMGDVRPCLRAYLRTDAGWRPCALEVNAPAGPL